MHTEVDGVVRLLYHSRAALSTRRVSDYHDKRQVSSIVPRGVGVLQCQLLKYTLSKQELISLHSFRCLINDPVITRDV